MREFYRDFHIVYAPPPIPVRNADWQFYHKDYDGAPDSNDNRCGFAPSLEAAKAEIDEMIDDEPIGNPPMFKSRPGLDALVMGANLR